MPVESVDKTPEKTTDSKACQTGINKKSRATQCGTKSFSTTSTQTEEEEETIGTHLHNSLQDVWELFAQTLEKNNQKEKFAKLITALGNGFLKASNLAWKCALDMGQLSMCTTTTNMRYDKDCVEFFSLFNLMFGSSAINVLRGTAHFGTLVDVTNQRGLYDPTEGNYNFPIPSINTLRKVACGYPSNIGVGLIEHSLDMAQEQSENGGQFVISFDGKMVAQGCKNECDGDVNLWGREKPNLDGTIKKLRRCIDSASNVEVPADDGNIDMLQRRIRMVSYNLSDCLKNLNLRIRNCFRQRQRLVALAKENPNNVQRYNARMSFLHQNSADCEQVYNSGLETQKFIFCTLAKLNQIMPPEDHLILSNIPNCFQLLPPNLVAKYVDLKNEANSDLIKQRTPEWEVLRKSCRVTGSTLHKALGLDGLARQKEHHHTFLCGRSESVLSSEIKKRMEHGTNNEKNILATLIGLIIPAFLPPCYAFFEVGAKFISGTSCREKVEVSADGILKCTEGDNCVNNHENKNIVIEIKSPFPTKENPHVTTYDIPVRYIPQILCEMEAWECSELWLLCGTKASVTLFQCFHDKTLLQKLLAMKDDLYASEKPNIPTRLHPSVPEMKEYLRKYIPAHTVFKGEIPALTGDYGEVVESDVIPSAYGVTPPAKKKGNHPF